MAQRKRSETSVPSIASNHLVGTQVDPGGECPRPQLLYQLEELLEWVIEDEDEKSAAVELLAAFARARERATGRPDR